MKAFRKAGVLPGLKLLIMVSALIGIASTAYADLETSVTDLKDQILAISTPIAIILLIFAGWQKSLGNQHIFYGAIVGVLIVFGAPLIVAFVKTAFGI
jgi:hypothetical protein